MAEVVAEVVAVANKDCPKCGIALTFIEPEPDVGIEGGWICEACGHDAPIEPSDYNDYDD